MNTISGVTPAAKSRLCSDSVSPKTGKVWVVVLHYGGADYTRKCLESLQNLSLPPDGIVLTDNCSPDNSGEAISREFPHVHYQQLPDNLGFAGGSNAGIRLCIERGADWIWLLNNDTEANPDSLEKLMEVASSSPEAGVLGALVQTPGKHGPVVSGTGIVDFKKAKTYERDVVDRSVAFKACEWISGCNLLVRAEAFTKVGGFDERYFLYFEDTDLCYRLNAAGWQCLVVPAAQLRHEGNVSTGEKLSAWRSYYHTRNRFLFFAQHAKGYQRILAFMLIATHVLRHTLVLPFRGTRGMRQLRAELLGFRDFLSGKFGKAGCLDF